MAKAALVQKGDNIDYINSTTADIAYLDVVPLGERIGIALENIPIGEIGSVAVADVWEMPAVTGAVFEVGDTLYWDTAAGNLTNVTGDIVAGWATEAVTASAVTARVKIG